MDYYGTAIPAKTTTEFLFPLEFFPVIRLYKTNIVIVIME